MSAYYSPNGGKSRYGWSAVRNAAPNTAMLFSHEVKILNQTPDPGEYRTTERTFEDMPVSVLMEKAGIAVVPFEASGEQGGLDG